MGLSDRQDHARRHPVLLPAPQRLHHLPAEHQHRIILQRARRLGARSGGSLVSRGSHPAARVDLRRQRGPTELGGSRRWRLLQVDRARCEARSQDAEGGLLEAHVLAYRRYEEWGASECESRSQRMGVLLEARTGADRRRSPHRNREVRTELQRFSASCFFPRMLWAKSRSATRC